MIRLLVILFLILPEQSYTQDYAHTKDKLKRGNEIGLLPIQNFSPKEYNGRPQNWAIVQDHRGVMYFANSGGILEYDGVNWRLIKTPGDVVVRSLAVDDRGTIYAGLEIGLGHILPDSLGNMTYYSLMDHLDEEHQEIRDVWSTYVAEEGVYFQTRKTIFLWNGKSMSSWTTDNTYHICYLIDNILYVRERNVGLKYMHRGSLELINEGEQFADEGIFAMFPDDSGQIIIITDTRGLYKITDPGNPGKTKILNFSTQADQFLLDNRIYGSVKVDKDVFSIGTSNAGVIILNNEGKIKRVINKNAGLQDDNITYQFIDNSNNLWLALRNGISMVEINSPLSTLNDKTGLKGGVETITRHNGTIFVGTLSGAYYLSVDERSEIGMKDFSKYEYAKFKPVEGVSVECYDLLSFTAKNNKNILLGALLDGIYTLDERTPATQIINCYPWVMHQSVQDPNRVYIGLDPGLSSIYYVNGQWKYEGKMEGIDERIFNITEESDGTLWLGTFEDGVVRIKAYEEDEPKIKKFYTDEGLPKGAIYASMISGRIIFGTSQGIFKFLHDEGKFVLDTSFGEMFTIGAPTIHRISADKDGSAWMTTIWSDDRLEIGYLGRTPGKMKWNTKPFRSLSKEVIHDFLHDDDGITWLGGPDGLFRFDHSVTKNYERDFNTFIRQAFLGRDSVIFWGNKKVTDSVLLGQLAWFNPEVPYENNSIGFQFSCTNYEKKEYNVFSYYMEGFDSEWTAWNDETKTIYTNLPEGRYNFRVRAKNIYGTTSETEYSFTIRPPWFRTIWFYLGLFVIFSGFIYSYILIRVANRRNKKQKNLIQDSYDKLESANADLRDFAFVVSHDLKAPLRGISNLANFIVEDYSVKLDEKGKEMVDLLTRRVDRMQNLITGVLNYSTGGGDNKVATRISLDGLLPEIIDMIAPPENINISLQDDLPEMYGERSKLIQVFQNLIGNAVKYMDKDRGEINVTYSKKKDEWEFSISDNGPGIEEKYYDKIFQIFQTVGNREDTDSTGIGLALVHKIITGYGGRVWVESEVGKGSTFYFTLPRRNLHN